MAAYATKLAEAFASRAMQRYYQRSVAEAITNQDYEGEVRDRTSRLNILTFGALTLKDYASTAMTADDVTESNGQLITDQQKAHYFKIRSLDKFKSYVKNPESTLLQNASDVLKETVDTFVLGKAVEAAGGQWLGTSYATGTVTIDVTTGAVTGSGTTFAAGMVGKPFKAVGHTKWYRVKTYTSTTAIVIENDSDDETSAYDGGAISGGTAYEIQGNAAVQVAKTTIYAKLIEAKTLLDHAKIPAGDRFFVAPAEITNLFLSATELIPAVPAAYDEKIKRGLVGTVAGFQVYQSEQCTGTTAAGWYCLAGHKSAITMATGFVESGIEDLVGDFGKAYKGLTVYGAKVVDERRKALVNCYFKL